MMRHPPESHSLPRRAFHRAALLALAALLDACRPAPALPIPTPQPDPSPTLPPTPTLITAAPPTALPVPTASPTPDRRLCDLYAAHRERLRAILAESTDRHVRLVVRPLAHPELEVNFGGGDVQRAASTIKALILIYALFKDPALDLHGPSAERPASDAYRMIVSSHNAATARVLIAAAGAEERERALDLFNDFAHRVLGLPPQLGLTQWDYWPTIGLRAQGVGELPTDEFPQGVPNPITLDALVDFYTLLETPHALREAAERAADLYAHRYPSRAAYIAAALEATERAKALLAIPDPDYVTQMEIALEAARAAHPTLVFEMYGKNGTLSPADWDIKRWHINEAGVVTLSQGQRVQKFVLAFSSASFHTSTYLNAALEYCVALFAAPEAASGGCDPR